MNGMNATDRSDLVDLRVIGDPGPARRAVDRLAEVFTLDRQAGPRPSRKTPGHVLYYLTAHVPPTSSATATTRAVLGDLSGVMAPLAEIEDLKAARDLSGELAAISGHWAQMEAQPWWPPQPGDVAIGHPLGTGRDAYGETFLAEDHPPDGLRFRSVSRTRGSYAPEDGYAIEDLWFEWPAISIVRAGTIYPPVRPGRRRPGRGGGLR